MNDEYNLSGYLEEHDDDCGCLECQEEDENYMGFGEDDF